MPTVFPCFSRVLSAPAQMDRTERREVVRPLSPAEALYLFDPPDAGSAGSSLVSHRDPTHVPNNWDSDQSPGPVMEQNPGETDCPGLGHMSTSADWSALLEPCVLNMREG